MELLATNSSQILVQLNHCLRRLASKHTAKPGDTSCFFSIPSNCPALDLLHVLQFPFAYRNQVQSIKDFCYLQLGHLRTLKDTGVIL